MKGRYGKFNPKRQMADLDPAGKERLCELADRASYGGNPEHKKNPGDFGLTPPANSRMGKSLCDAAGIFTRKEALELLREGLRRGLASDRQEQGWPRNIWAQTDAGVALEAQLENPQAGTYHGYPMPESDPFAGLVKERWEQPA